MAYARQGQDRRAIRAFERYLSLSPNASDAAAIKARIAELGR